MRLQWTSKALGDIARLHDFLKRENPTAAAKAVQALVSAPAQLMTHPKIGEPLEQYQPRDVRRILVGQYELRYEIANATSYVLRIWHTRENR